MTKQLEGIQDLTIELVRNIPVVTLTAAFRTMEDAMEAYDMIRAAAISGRLELILRTGAEIKEH